MKIRFIWRFTSKNYGKDGDYSFWGTCPKWAQEYVDRGVEMVKTRVAWVGKVPVCGACHYGLH